MAQLEADGLAQAVIDRMANCQERDVELSEDEDSDAVFGVCNSLIVKFSAHPAGKAPDGRTMDKPFHIDHYDFTLVPTA